MGSPAPYNFPTLSVPQLPLIPQVHQEDLIDSNRFQKDLTGSSKKLQETAMESHLVTNYEGKNLVRSDKIQRSPFCSRTHYEYAPQSLHCWVHPYCKMETLGLYQSCGLCKMRARTLQNSNTMAASKFTTIPQVQQEDLIGTHRNPFKKISKAFENNAKQCKTILGAHISRNPRVNGGLFFKICTLQ